MPQGTPYPFLAIGGVLSLIALVLILRTAMFLLGSARVTGTIVGTNVTHSVSHRRRSATYSPRIAYVVDGESFEHIPAISSTTESFDVGSEVALRYDPNAPYDARIDRFRYLWLAPTILGLLGLPCVALAVMMMLNTR